MSQQENKTILDTLKQDLTNSDTFHDDWTKKHRYWIKAYNGDLYGNEKNPNKAKVVSRDIKKASVWQLAQVVDPFVSSPNMVKVDAISHEDEAISEQTENILNYQWSREFDRYNFVSNSFKTLQREGTVFAKVSWESSEAEVEIQEPIVEMVPVEDINQAQQMIANGVPPYEEVITGYETKTVTKTIYNRPTAELLDNAFVYVDPTVEGKAEDGNFMIIKYSSNMSKLNENKDLYKDLDKVKDLMQSELEKSRSNYENDEGNFKFTDEARREFEVIEYWGNYDLNGDGIAEEIVCVWVGDIIIRLEENPYPDNKKPFVSCTIDSEPLSPYGNPNADLIDVDQKIETGIKRSLLNTLDSSTNGQKGMPVGSMSPLEKKKFERGDDFEYNAQNGDIWVGDYNPLPSSVFQFSESIKRNIDELTGTRAFGAGNGSMGSATEARGALDAVAKREIDITRNYAQNFIIPILEKWNSLNSVYLSVDDVQRITNKPFVHNRDDMRSNLDIDISISTAETDASKSGELSFMLQTMGQSLPFDMTKMILSEIADLKRMPELSMKIQNFVPQPDPLEQQIKQLEIAKLQSEIALNQSKANENGVDLDLKSAKADNERAKTRSAHAKADLDDQSFVKNADGSAHAEELDKENNRAQNQAVLQAQNNSNATK